MSRFAIVVSLVPLIATLAACASPSSGSQQLMSKQKACDAVKSSVQSRANGPIPSAATCDFLEPADSPKGYYVLALHSHRACDGICSDNMGWFAVDKTQGSVFEWDVAADRVGPALTH